MNNITLRKPILPYYFLLLCLVSGLSACSSGSYPSQSSSYPSSVDQSSGITESGLEDEFPPSQNRIVIYNAYLTLIVEEPESLGKSLQSIAESYGGYLQKSGTEEAVLRIKSESLKEVLAKLETMGKVRNKRISGEDVTENYQDLKIRLENAEKLRLRYLDLLDKAKEVEEILKIERELERINTEIDLYKGKRNYLENQSALATIRIDIEKKVKAGPIGLIFVGAYKAVRWLFVWK